MIAPTVKVLSRSAEGAAIETMMLAFAADPMMRWAWPEAPGYLAAMPRFVPAFGGRAFDCGGAHATEGLTGVALWLAPGVQPDEQAMQQVLQETAPASVMPHMPAIFEQMAKYHPTEPHWYLPLIGVDPAHQGAGQGAALLRHALQRCDREGLPAYLEASSPRNLALYQRHGFEIVGTIQAGTSPPVTAMLRRSGDPKTQR